MAELLQQGTAHSTRFEDMHRQMQPGSSPKSDEESENVWGEEVVEQAVRPTSHRRPIGSEEDSPLAKLVRSISSDDQWDGFDEEEKGREKIRKRKKSSKTYHDPTIVNIKETEPLACSWYESSNESDEEIMNSGGYSTSACSSLSDAGEQDDSEKKNATMMPVVLLRYLFRHKGHRERLNGSSTISNIDGNPTRLGHKKNGHAYSGPDEHTNEDPIVPEAHTNLQSARHVTQNGEPSQIGTNRNFTAEFLPVALLQRLKKKISPKHTKSSGKRQDDFCPICGQSLSGIRLPDDASQRRLAITDEVVKQERNLSESRMWRVTLVEARPAVRNVYKSVLKMEIDANKAPDKVVQKEENKFTTQTSAIA